ncbi:MAG: class I SAM-dependent methyltransferase [Pelovirga sp.]
MNSRYSQEKWNQRWQEKASSAEWQADQWLVQTLPYLPDTGTALDLACGMGRNALCLAERGYRVTAVDFSEVALNLLRQAVMPGKGHIDVIQADLEAANFQFPQGPFDLVLQCYYLYRPLLPALLEAVRPGGFAIIRTFSRAGEEQFGPVNKGISLAPGELLHLFSEWDILLYEEGLEPSRKGGSLAGIFARKKKRGPCPPLEVTS